MSLHVVPRMSTAAALFEKLPPINNPAKYIASPIFYLNANPHLGHLYTLVLCDAYSRWIQLRTGNRPIFSTGTDEHGSKVASQAARSGQTNQVYCDNVSRVFKKLANGSACRYTHFVRTTDPEHKNELVELWKRIMATGDVEKKTFSGYYSVSEETFVPEEQTVVTRKKDGTSVRTLKDDARPVEKVEEENYQFNLGKYLGDLEEWYLKNPSVVAPVNRYHETVQMIRRMRQRPVWLSISRPAGRVPWGVPVPGDESQTIYVWLDALANYHRVSHQPAVHVIGKDILKFHAIYWPAFLMSAGHSLPQKIFCHSHWTSFGRKMSKSLGNTVDPFKLLDAFGPGMTRYYLLKQSFLGKDSNFCEDHMVEVLKKDLPSQLGNLVTRSIRSAAINPLRKRVVDGEWLSPDIFDQWQNIVLKYDKAVLNLEFGQALHLLMEGIANINESWSEIAPWNLVPSDEKTKDLLFTTHEIVDIAANLLRPVMPEEASRLQSGLVDGCRELPFPKISVRQRRPSHLSIEDRWIVRDSSPVH